MIKGVSDSSRDPQKAPQVWNFSTEMCTPVETSVSNVISYPKEFEYIVFGDFLKTF